MGSSFAAPAVPAPTQSIGNNLLFVRDCEQASHNGELVVAELELGAVLAGQAEGRRTGEEATVFDSTGLAIQDLAIALAALERAGELDLPRLEL
jgi:alanine dehydrogenase